MHQDNFKAKAILRSGQANGARPEIYQNCNFCHIISLLGRKIVHIWDGNGTKLCWKRSFENFLDPRLDSWINYMILNSKSWWTDVYTGVDNQWNRCKQNPQCLYLNSSIKGLLSITSEAYVKFIDCHISKSETDALSVSVIKSVNEAKAK